MYGKIMEESNNPASEIDLFSKSQFSNENSTFTVKVCGTCYEVSAHFDPEGRQTLYEQFKNLILSKNFSV